MNLVTRGTIRITSNLRLLVLSHDPFVATFTVHATASITRICSMGIMAKTTGIDVAVGGVGTDNQFAKQRRVHARRPEGPSAVTLHAAGGWNPASCRRRRLVVVARKTSDFRHTAVVHFATVVHN